MFGIRSHRVPSLTGILIVGVREQVPQGPLSDWDSFVGVREQVPQSPLSDCDSFVCVSLCSNDAMLHDYIALVSVSSDHKMLLTT